MLKKIQRKVDNKFLLSLESDIWVDNMKESKTFNLNEFNVIKGTLLTSYQENDLKIYTNYQVRTI